MFLGLPRGTQIGLEHGEEKNPKDYEALQASAPTLVSQC